MQQYPVIPKEEFIDRQQKVKAFLKENALDLFIAYADDKAVYGPAYARWLFNYAPHFEPCCILIPAEGEAVILTGPESDQFIYATSHCRNVKVINEFSHPGEEYLFAQVTTLESVIGQMRKELDRDISKVGIVGLEMIPHLLYEAMGAIFGPGNMVDIEYQMLKLRAIKSENEIRVIEYAYFIAEKGLQAAIRSIAEGKSEREIAAEAEYTMRRLGSEGMGIDTIVASGVHNTYPVLARTTHRKIGQGDLVLLTIAPRYEGYHGALGMPVILGKPDKAVEEAMTAAIEAQHAAKDALRPGTPGHVVDRAARQVLEKAGLQSHVQYSAIHSVGVIEFEAPILTSAYRDEVQENMVFSIDIPLFSAPWGGLRFENGFHVTKDGARPLQTVQPEIICL
ncbi:aminopeptidase P family protein [Paenibacillus hemerocallicola]|uniref:Aminopeptidase P family protein n=1 Tax=Paenibacillus hemerocallicola TaxID=1172614 RepID=A0A5C4TDH6_9BACL|nr:Xaa-Pro peptidase family protein [Paenibacillus hemerocallicola]TNJ66955.1 aminopeptidase P family protein [Paenibacillus hemerocallicola]